MAAGTGAGGLGTGEGERFSIIFKACEWYLSIGILTWP